MRRIKLVLAVATAVAVMMVAAAPAMAHISGTNGSSVAFSAQNFGGNHDSGSDNNIGFGSFGNSSLGSVEFDGGSNGGGDVNIG
jgi:hypothetical protein